MIPIGWLVISVLILLAAMWIWRRFRLRRAWFILRQQITWSRKFAPRSKLVLDVGAGNNPHIRADVVCEKYLYDDLHRGSGVTLERPLIVGDAGALPFKTKVFDAIIARAVIEHLTDPESFFNEAGRVAKSGVFIAPTATYEHLHSLSTHLWLIEQQDHRLHFAAKPRAVIDPVVHQFFTRQVMSNLKRMDDFTIDHWDALRVTYQWADQPECVIEGRPQIESNGFRQASTFAPTERHPLAGFEKWRAAIKGQIRVMAHALVSAHRSLDLTAILACPNCHGDVSITSSAVQCHQCQLNYPIENGIPIMLIDHARPLGHEQSA